MNIIIIMWNKKVYKKAKCLQNLQRVHMYTKITLLQKILLHEIELKLRTLIIVRDFLFLFTTLNFTSRQISFNVKLFTSSYV